jgi:uncharacterized phage protein gp47/JayE
MDLIDISSLCYIDATGYHYADFPTTLAAVQGAFQSIYGADVYLGADSQDGQWTSVLAQAFYDTFALGAATYSSLAPSTAQGVGLSRIVKFNGLVRITATYSTVDLVIVGVAGTVIANGVAADSLQQQWALPSSVTIPNSGTITVTATAVQVGALQALPNTITTIFTPTNGWQTVNNPAAATAGVGVESDGALRIRQTVSTSLPAQTVFDATIAAVANTAGVTAVEGYENYTNSTDANGLPPHSISIVAEGGDDTAVATAIQIKKTPGTDTYGTTSVPLTDSQGMPITINFYRPTVATIGVQVSLTRLAGWDISYETLIADSIAAYITNTTIIPIGGDIVITKLYVQGYLNGTNPTAAATFNLESIELKKNSGSFAASDIQLLFNEIAACDPTANVSFILT